MPNRILREGIILSERVEPLDYPEEVFYRRLMSVADDYGRFHANLQILRSSCFPLRTDRVRLTDVSRWIAACVKTGLIALYRAADEKDYIQILRFGQRTRSPSKFPAPGEALPQHDAGLTLPTEGICKTAVAICEQMPARASNTPTPTTPSPNSLEEGSGEKPAMVNLNANVQRPSWDEVWLYAQPLGLAEWKARDWLDEMDACGWKDHNNRSVVQWRPMLTRVLRKWEADGRPAGPPSNAKNSKPDHRAEKAAREYPQEIQLKRL